jgi:hypothetical protein
MYVLENLLKFSFFKFLSHFIVKCGNFDNFKPKYFVLVHVIPQEMKSNLVRLFSLLQAKGQMSFSHQLGVHRH